MKRRKKLWAMAALLGLVLVVTVSAALIGEKVEKIQASGQPILEIPVDSLTALSWDHDGETLSFHKDGEGWHYEGDEEFPVSAYTLESMAAPFERFSAAFRIDEVEDYSQYGLEQPVLTIGITAAEQDYTVRVGAFSQMDDQRYVDIGDGSVYLVYHDPMMEFDVGLRQVIDHESQPYFEGADRITFTGKENYIIEAEPEQGQSYREDDVYFVRQDGIYRPLSTAAVNSYLSTISLLHLTDYKTYTADAEDLGDYGLDAPELTIQVDYTPEDTQETFLLHMARDPKALQEAQQAEDPESVPVPVYARVGDSRIIYEIGQVDYDSLMACGYDDLRHQEIFPASIDDVTAMTVTLEGQQYRIESAMDEEDDRLFTFGGQEVDGSLILSALRSLNVEEFTQEPPTGRQEIRLDVTIRDTDTVALEFYRLDGRFCLAKVDGQVIGTLPRSQVVELVEQINTVVLEPQPTDPSEPAA